METSMNWYRYIKAEEVPEEDLGMIREFNGLRINVENPAGTERVGVDPDGHEWRTKMKYDYGFICSQKGGDEEGLDVYLGPNWEAENVYVVRQVDPYDDYKFDEEKVMLGFDDAEAAKTAYLHHYDRSDFFDSMTEVPFDEFKAIAESDDESKVDWPDEGEEVLASNWYRKFRKVAKTQKLASVTFSIVDSHKISQPQTIMDLGHDLSKFFYRGTKLNHGTAPTLNDISPDGFDFDKYEGTINVYPTKRIEAPENAERELSDAWYGLDDNEKIQKGGRVFDNSLENMMPVIDEWIQSRAAEGYRIEKKDDVSNMSGGPVLRLNVIENPSKEYSQIPEINMSNANAKAIMEMLGVQFDWSGSISAQDLRDRINNVSGQQIDDNALEDSVDRREDGEVNMISFGRPSSYIDHRLQNLYELADFAISNNFSEVQWA